MKKMNKQLLSALLALMMLLNSCPMPAFAVDTGTETENVSEITQETQMPTTEPPATQPVEVSAAEVCETCGETPCTCEKAAEVYETCGETPCTCEKAAEVCETCGETPCTCEKAAEVCETCGETPCICEAATEPTEEPTEPEQDPAVGCVAKITSAFPILWKDPTNGDSSNQLNPAVGTMPAYVRIVDAHQFSESVKLYKLDAADGYTWPEEYKDHRYMESTKLTLVSVCNVCGGYECTSAHQWCENCEKYDCVEEHTATEPTVETTQTPCDKCAVADCTSEHANWCDDCKKDVCGVDHTAQVSQIPVTSTGPEQQDPMVDKLVKLVEGDSYALRANPADWSTTAYVGNTAFPAVMKITDVYRSGNDVFYKLGAIDGETWPAAPDGKVYEGYYLISTKLELIENEPENTCKCCENCTGNEECQCGCDGCAFCKKETTCECGCENCTGEDGCQCQCGQCDFCEEVIPELKDETTGITVYAESLPAGTSLSVENADVSSQLAQFGVAAEKMVFGLDISLILDDADYQPEGGAMVKVPVSAPVGTRIGILHTHNGSTTYMGMTEVQSDGTVEFYTGGFSQFAGFTVDFHYNGIDYSIAGLTSITLSELFEILEIDRDAAHAVSVAFSDPSLVEVTKQEGDWLLTSLEAFDTEETLEITFANGEIIVIDVTDANNTLWGGAATLSTSGTVTNQADYYLYDSATPGAKTTLINKVGDTSISNPQSAHLRQTGSNLTTLSINKDMKGNQNYWYYATATNVSITYPSDLFQLTLKATKGTGEKIYIERINREIFTVNGHYGVYQMRYIATSAEPRTVNIVLNRDDNIVKSATKYFANRGDSVAAGQLDVDYIPPRKYYFWNINTGAECATFNEHGQYQTSNTNFYEYNTNNDTYTIRLKSRFYIDYDGNGANVGTMDDEQAFIYGITENYLIPNAFDKIYDVTFDANGTTASPAYISAEDKTTTTTVQADFSFNGWSGSDGNSYADRQHVKNLTETPGQVITMTAKWTGGSVSLPTPTRVGYRFLGWYTEATGGTQVTGSYTPTSDDTTLYAHWEANSDTQYTVETYVQNIAGDQYTKTVEYKKGITDTEATVTPEAKQGFTYNAKMSTVSGNIAADGSLVLKVYYDRIDYTVSLTKGTGISAVSGAGTYKFGQSVTIGATVADGYVWKNWTSGTSTVSASQSYTFTMPAGNVSYTANTDRCSYAVTYQYTGTVPANAPAVPASFTKKYGEEVTIPTAPSMVGYTFSGWTTSDATISGGKFIMPSKAVTISGSWSPNTNTAYKIETYKENANDNGYTMTSENKTGTTGTTATATISAPTGFTYNASKSTASGTIAADGSLVLKVYYDRIDYTVTLNKETGISGVSGAGTYKFGQSVTIGATVADGYVWKNWTSGTSTVSASQSYTFTMPAGNVTYTANADRRSYAVAYQYTGTVPANAPAVPAQSSVLYGDEVTVAATPSMEGYTFSGWTTSDATISDGKFVMPGKAVTLTGSWEINTYTITFVNEDGTVLQSSKVAYGDMPVYNGDPPVMSGNGQYTHKFIDWDKELTSVDGEATYTATYKRVAYMVTYDTKGGESVIEPDIIDVGSTGTIKGDGLGKTGFSFLGWVTDPSDTQGSGTTYAPGDVYGDDPSEQTDITLYALWGHELNVSIVDEDGNLKGTISYRTSASPDTAEDWTAAEARYFPVGSMVNDQIVFTPAVGYAITKIEFEVGEHIWTDNTQHAVNKVFTYEMGDAGFTANTTIVVTTKRVQAAQLILSGDNGMFTLWENDQMIKELPVGTYTFDIGAYKNAEIIFDPAYGYRIQEVEEAVPGVSTKLYLALPNEYTYSIPPGGLVEGATRISVTTVKEIFDLTVTADEGAVVGEGVPESVEYQGTVEIQYAPKPGYKIDSITVNGTSMGTSIRPDGGTLELVIDANTLVDIKTRRAVFTITFDVAGGTPIDPVRYNYGDAVTAPENPTKPNARFLDWSPELPETMPERDITVVARWEEAESLTISVNGDSNETFLFSVKGTTEEVDMIVSVHGGSSVTIGGLYHDTYTVSELSGWSWTRGDVAVKKVTLTTEDGINANAVAFEMPGGGSCWLHNENHN